MVDVPGTEAIDACNRARVLAPTQQQITDLYADLQRRLSARQSSHAPAAYGSGGGGSLGVGDIEQLAALLSGTPPPPPPAVQARQEQQQLRAQQQQAQQRQQKEQQQQQQQQQQQRAKPEPAEELDPIQRFLSGGAAAAAAPGGKGKQAPKKPLIQEL